VLDDIDRFQDSKHACAYLGLVPWLDESADVTHRGHITKGDKWLRRNLIECARAAVRKDANIREFYTRLRKIGRTSIEWEDDSIEPLWHQNRRGTFTGGSGQRRG
jgi:transposase